MLHAYKYEQIDKSPFHNYITINVWIKKKNSYNNENNNYRNTITIFNFKIFKFSI